MARHLLWGGGPSCMLGTVDINSAVDRYLDHRIKTQPRSWKDQAKTLNRMVKLFAGRELDTITSDELQDWRDAWPIKHSSANKYFDRVRAFFRHAIRYGWITHNPCDTIDDLHEDRPKQIRINTDLFPEVLSSARHPRNRAAIALALELLPRGNELAGIRVGDVDLDRRTVTLHVSKGRNEYDDDCMAISAELAEHLRVWLAAYRAECGLVTPDCFLFPRMDGRRHGSDYHYQLFPHLPISAPWEVVKSALRTVGVEVELGTGFHAIRRSAARLLFDHLIMSDEPYDRAMTRVSSLMHHTSRANTERYLGISGDRVIRNKIIHAGGATPLSLLSQAAKPAGSVSSMFPLPQ